MKNTLLFLGESANEGMALVPIIRRHYRLKFLFSKEEGLEYIATHPNSVTLVLASYELPKMTWQAFIQTMTTQHPTIPVIAYLPNGNPQKKSPKELGVAAILEGPILDEKKIKSAIFSVKNPDGPFEL